MLQPIQIIIIIFALFALSRAYFRLKDSKISFEAIEHRKVFTAWDSASTQHVEPKAVAKTLVVKLVTVGFLSI